MRHLLRDAEAADYDAVGALAARLVGFDTCRRAAFDSALASPDHDLIVAELAGQVVGFAHVLTYEDVTHGAPAADLLGLYVQPDHRRRGIATALLRETCRRARRRRVHELHVSTEPDNEAALSLYRRHGAETVGIQLEFELE
jgi:ribosomal protein S18 acetylase RimI-like enzyme